MIGVDSGDAQDEIKISNTLLDINYTKNIDVAMNETYGRVLSQID